MKKLLAAIFLLTAILSSANAQTAQHLQSVCRSVANAQLTEQGIKLDSTFETGLCWGYFAVIQELTRFVDSQNRPRFSICSPESSTRSQLIRVFVTYVDKVPERLHEDGFQIALESLRRAFPCPANQ